MKHLSPEGRIVIAIENKYGLKYFAGCKEDHIGSYFSGIENYTVGGGVRTFSRRGLEKIFKECNVKEYSFYYPYPDYKFMTTVYSDAYLPGKGELHDNIRNFDRDRMLLFDEKSAFDGIVEDGLFSIFANSYCAVIGKELPIKYVKAKLHFRHVGHQKPFAVVIITDFPLERRSFSRALLKTISKNSLQKTLSAHSIPISHCKTSCPCSFK